MSKDYLTFIREAGVVGAGGAGFPTHVKVNGKAEFVIVNGAECEPLLRVDQQLFVYRTIDVLEGLRIVVEQVGAKKGIVALKKKYKTAIERLNSEIERMQLGDRVEIFLLDDFYPAGDEQVLVYEVLQRIVPEGGIPLQVGTVVSNVETLLNVSNAVKGIPVYEKYITVTGMVHHPITVKVPLGITVREVLELAGGSKVENFRIIDGGPMMGKLVSDLEQPVTKTTKGLIVLSEDHPLILSRVQPVEKMLHIAKATCCHCSMCTEVCPRNLLGHSLHPDKLMRLASYQTTAENDSKTVTEAFLCTGCSLCEVACVMNLQPWKINQWLKGQLGAAKIRNPHNNQPEEVHEFREYKKFPTKRLIANLGIEEFNVDAPFVEDELSTYSTVVLNRRQHIGANTTPVVKVGDFVKAGQLIADIAPDQLGTALHASISGIILKIEEDRIEIRSS